MKNKLIILITIVSVLGFYFLKNAQSGRKEIESPQTSKETITVKPAITLVVNDGERIATYSGVTAQNALEILTNVAEKEQIPLVTKKYDFGTFVQKIGDKESGTAMAWIYFINGKSGEVAADKAILTKGDTVEWKYMKSIY